MSEKKIIELERILTYQSLTVEELKEVVYTQEKRIAELERQINVITDKFNPERLVKPLEEEEPPPHY